MGNFRLVAFHYLWLISFFDNSFFSEKRGRVKTLPKSPNQKKLGNDTY